MDKGYEDDPEKLYRSLTLKRLIILSVGEDMEKLDLSYIADENLKWYHHFGK